MMATATAVPAAADVDGLQQPYDRFEVAQFIRETSQTANMADSPTAPSTTSVHSASAPAAETVEPLSRPASTSTDAPARSEPSAAASAPSSRLSAHRPLRPAHNGFAVLNLNRPADPRPGTLGPNRDGRVKNPVPRKLKGKTDEINGEFGVMHMDMSGQGRVGRSSAAQITSESTAQAARNAQKGGYISLKKRRIEAEADLLQRQALEGHRYLPILPVREYTPRDAPLTPEQTKLEQARLLTLLRSINPVNVVDQICKAIAFFGGIPGAPAPADGFFPASAESNGKGELFIGWLSEIFPELGRKAWKPEDAGAREQNPGKRGRGRPKGSKASKVRKDKGIKKGPVRKSGATDAEAGAAGDDEWVDVVDVAASDDEASEAEESRQRQQPAGAHSLPFTNPNRRDLEAAHDENDNDQEIPNSTATQSQELIPSAVTPKNKGGRPKGSKNKPKFPPGTIIPETQLSEVPSSAATMITPQSFHQALQQATANIAAGFPAVNSTPRTESSRPQATPGTAGTTEGVTPKNKGGRPRGSKNKPKDAAMQAHMSTPSFTGAAIANLIPHMDGGSPLKRRPGRPRKESMTAAAPATSPQIVGLSAEERAVLEAYRAVRASQTPAAAPTTPATGEKRKRGRPRRSETQPANANTEETTETANAAQAAASSATMQVESPSVTALLPSETPQAPDSAKPPPAKRQRRPKDTIPSPAKRKQQEQSSVAQQSPSLPAPAQVPAPAPAPILATANQTSQSPAMQPTVISPSFPTSTSTSNTLSQQHPSTLRTPSQSQQTNTTHTLSQMSMPPVRPRPSGLEAHYEQFAAAAKQQNQPPPQAQNPSNRDPNENQNLISRLGMQTSGQTTPSYFAQAHRSGASGMGYGQGYGAQQQYHTSQNSPQLDSYRSQSNGNITPQQQKTFSPQTQNHGNSNHYGGFNSPDLFDMSSLETRNGSIGSGNYSGISRAAGASRVPNTGFGGGANRIGDGFSSDLSEQELRERILRGIGRR